MDASSPSLPQRLEITPRGAVDATVRVPGSKSVTNRALLVAALAEGESHILAGLESIDTLAMRTALGELGVVIERLPAASEDPPDAASWRVAGCGGHLVAPEKPLRLENAGTATRFLTAAATLASGPVVVDGNARMRERPIQDLVEALRALGAEVEIRGRDGCPPVCVAGGGLPGGRARIDARRSSQYVSAILLAAPYAARDVELDFVDDTLVSRPYVDLTLEVMRAFGADAAWTEAGGLRVTAGRLYRGREFVVEADASSAAYPFCAAAVAGGRVRVERIPAASAQADFGLLALLERMGCSVSRGDGGVEVRGAPGRLRALGRVDMNALPDAVLAMSVVALFADGPTRIENVANLRIKETDRLAALETELRKLGARVETGPDWIEITPGPLRGAEIETYDDHRMAMAFSLAGLRVPGVVIRDPACVAKTWPNFFELFRHL